jgi:hypothetical protein
VNGGIGHLVQIPKMKEKVMKERDRKIKYLTRGRLDGIRKGGVGYMLRRPLANRI